MSLRFTVHEMISEKASASCGGHSGYNLSDETAVRYGHSNALVLIQIFRRRRAAIGAAKPTAIRMTDASMIRFPVR